jgi:hypothetical protein
MSAIRTIRVELDFPEAVLDEFHAAMREREHAGMAWLTLPVWLRNHTLNSLMDEHMRRVLAPIRTMTLLVPPEEAPPLDLTRGQKHRRWLRTVLSDEGGEMSHFDDATNG